jgi:glycosyltransferase involved in cell wall biosynthesis
MSRLLHLVTGEFPPDLGGVSAYSAAIAGGLAAGGLPVHVWCTTQSEPSSVAGVAVHRVHSWSGPHLRRVDREMDRVDATAPLLVQWVPHAYGRRSLNLAFCRWVRRRARRGQPVDLMVHEPFLAFRGGSIRQGAAAIVHRLMVWLLLAAARRVWISIPAWEECLRPWAFGRDLTFQWLPVPSSIPVVHDPGAVADVRARLAGHGRILIGHFGTYDALAREQLEHLLPAVLRARPDAAAVLLGRGSDAFGTALRTRHQELADRIAATGALDPGALSLHLQACDLLVQPYPDGVTARRTTVMAGLANGVPIVTTVGHHSEALWHESGVVHVAPSSQADVFVQATVAVIEDSPLRARLADAGRRIYATHFALDHTIRALRCGTATAPGACS